MKCECCGNDEAYISLLCNQTTTMCSKCRRKFDYFVRSTIEWRAYSLVSTAVGLYAGTGEMNKLMEAKLLLDDTVKEFVPLIEIFIEACKAESGV